MIERDLRLLKLSDESEYLRAVVVAAADQAAVDASLNDCIELYHLAGAYEKVIDSVNRALGHSLAQTGPQPLKSDAESLGLSGAFGGASDVYGLAQRVHSVYEKDFAKRTRVSKGAWETLGTLLQLKKALSQFAADRPDLALEVCSPKFMSTGRAYIRFRLSNRRIYYRWIMIPLLSLASLRRSRRCSINPRSRRLTKSS